MPAEIGIVMGSDSDLEVMQEAAKILEELDIEFEMAITSVHRCPDKAADYAKTAQARGLKVIIAGAGMASHLAGAVAAHSALPVIGVPIKKSFDGMDSLLATVQMPPGVPVATMAVNGARNAGILAAQILGSHDSKLHQKLVDFKNGMREKVEALSDKLEAVGYKEYLKQKAGL